MDMMVPKGGTLFTEVRNVLALDEGTWRTDAEPGER
jgi:hypothetical protein